MFDLIRYALIYGSGIYALYVIYASFKEAGL